jgi:hypothetical protein
MAQGIWFTQLLERQAQMVQQVLQFQSEDKVVT